jgi:hypothetical protein
MQRAQTRINDTDNSLHWVNPDTGANGGFATAMDSVADNPWECSDGRYLVFNLGLIGGKAGQNIWRADASGGNLKQLSNGKRDDYPVCSFVEQKKVDCPSPLASSQIKPTKTKGGRFRPPSFELSCW